LFKKSSKRRIIFTITAINSVAEEFLKIILSQCSGMYAIFIKNCDEICTGKINLPGII